jgi:hypothetical protein
MRGSDGSRILSLDAHPHIRRSAQQQAQHITGVGRNAITLIVEDARGEVKRPSPDQRFGTGGWLCTTAFFFLLQRVFDAGTFVFEAAVLSGL